jgi:hypothetical protein
VYAYTPKNGTSTLNRHKCDDFEHSNPEEEVQSSNANRIPEVVVKKIRDAEVKFVVSGYRPFRIVEDQSYRDLLQSVADTAARFGPIDIKKLIHCPKSLKSDISEQANEVLERCKLEMLECFGNFN